MSFLQKLSVIFLAQALFFQTNGKPTDNSNAGIDWDTYQNPELGEHFDFEGDIILGAKDAMTGKAGWNEDNKQYRWKDNIVPFKIKSGFTQDQQNLISKAIKELGSNTCIKFVPRVSQNDYIEYVRNDSSGCSSPIGRQGGPQQVTLASDCFTVGSGTVVHETMHALGIFHERNRPDRDNFVIIHNDRIQNRYKSYFYRDDPSAVSTFNVPYDYGSLMHFPKNAFPIKEGDTTITTTNPRNAKIGQRDKMSKSDIAKVKRMYKCK